eukprot:c24904_g1_i2 orf=160-1908(+)
MGRASTSVSVSTKEIHTPVLGKSIQASDPTYLELHKLRCNVQDRSKREDHLHSWHDHLFSDWKVLVGPTDWQGHAAGKEGVDRYRLQNLPTSYFGPGVYELGLCLIQHFGNGRKLRHRIGKRDVVVVYVGQAENVRSRLQHYGRSGSHLEGVMTSCAYGVDAVQNGRLHQHSGTVSSDSYLCSSSLKSKGSVQRSHLFTMAFSFGYSIAFRWTAVQSKNEAEKLEAELLRIFDYAWNRGSNGERRPDDVYTKLSLQIRRHRGLTKWKWILFGKRRAILSMLRKSWTEGGVSRGISTSRKFGKFLLTRICIGYSDMKGGFKEETRFRHAPKVLFKDNAERSPNCSEKCPIPVEFQHLGIRGTSSRSDLMSKISEIIVAEGMNEKYLIPNDNSSLDICSLGWKEVTLSQSNSASEARRGIVAEGLISTTPREKGWKHCDVHKGCRMYVPANSPGKNALFDEKNSTEVNSLRLQETTTSGSNLSSKVCEVDVAEVLACMTPLEKQVKWHNVGKSCRLPGSKSEEGVLCQSPHVCLITKSKVERNESKAFLICGILLENGLRCNLPPVKGRKRCESHKGMRINSST